MNVEYTVEYALSLHGITDRVNYQLERGWKAQGGLSRVPDVEDGGRMTYAQAMIKEDSDARS